MCKWVGGVVVKIYIVFVMVLWSVRNTKILFKLLTELLFHTIWSGLVCWCDFWLGYTCWTSIFFGTLKDSNLNITNLSLNNCFSYRKALQNGVNALSKVFFKKSVFVRTQNFVPSGPYDLIQISPACGPNT